MEIQQTEERAAMPPKQAPETETEQNQVGENPVQHPEQPAELLEEIKEERSEEPPIDAAESPRDKRGWNDDESWYVDLSGATRSQKAFIGRTRHVYSVAVHKYDRDPGRLVLHTGQDFDWLRLKLIAFFPGTFVPKLGSHGSIENREQGIVEFLNRVLEVKILRESELVQDFFKTNSESMKPVAKSWDDKEKRIWKNCDYSKKYFADLTRTYIKEYPEAFERFSSFPDKSSFDRKSVKHFMRESHTKFVQARKQLEAYFQKYQELCDDLSRIATTMDTIKTEETAQTFTPNEPERIDMVQVVQRWNQLSFTDIETFHNAFNDSVTRELGDIEALFETMDTLKKAVALTEHWADLTAFNNKNTNLTDAANQEDNTDTFAITSSHVLGLYFHEYTIKEFMRRRIHMTNEKILEFSHSNAESAIKYRFPKCGSRSSSPTV
jgi:hypothetical protein